MLWNAQMLLARVSGDEPAAAGVRDYLERWRQGRVVRTPALDACALHVCKVKSNQRLTKLLTRQGRDVRSGCCACPDCCTT